MKRYLVVIPVILFILLNACKNNPTPEEIAAYIQTMTATVWTPAPSSTPMYTYEKFYIIENLNRAIENLEITSTVDQLEHTLGPSYQVTNVIFGPDTSMPAVFQVDVRCECVKDGRCCNITRTFVVMIMALNQNPYGISIPSQVPGTVGYMEVRCFDHSQSIGVMSVPWNDVTNFLHGTISGFDLAAEITPAPVALP